MTTHNRQCNSCTKCCDGSLSGESYGHKFYKDKPCFFLILNKGCTIYKDRPSPQCTEFQCLWTTDLNIPEIMKPDKTDMIISYSYDAGIKQIHVTAAGPKFNKENLNWVIEYAKNTNQEVSWWIDGTRGWEGSELFKEKMHSLYKNQ